VSNVSSQKKHTKANPTDAAGPTDPTPDKGQVDADEPKYVFKSKFRGDKVKLLEATYRRGADGVNRILKPTVWADFERNTWSTTVPELAEALRMRIKERDKLRNPLRVWEVTEEAAEETKQVAATGA